MADKTLTAKYVLDASGVARGRKQASSEMAGLDSDAKKMSDGFDKHTSRMGGMFSTLGSTMGSFGIPFAGAVDRLGGNFDRAKSSGKGYGQALADVGKVASGALAGGLIAAGGESIHLAANFQTSMTELVTGAGESESAIGLVSKGIRGMAGAVGTGPQQLASGMYMIESAGYHGAEGLKVLRAAAEGAKVGNASMATVADAVTTALTDYHLPAAQAADITSKLVATVAAGKTHMEDLAGSLAKVLPVASAAGVGLDQVLGAMSTMTSKGTPAADAATYLSQVIKNLAVVTPKAALEMSNLGVSSTDIEQHLGTRGLTGTLKILTDAIAKHMGPAGMVLIDRMKAAAGSTTKFQAILAGLPPTQQTYIGALAHMVGGTKSMQAALELTGPSAATLVANVKTIGATTSEAGNHVQGFSKVHKDLNFQIEQAKAKAQALAITFGMVLIPKVETLIGYTASTVAWFQKHHDVALALAGVIGGALSIAVGAFAVNKIVGMIKGVQSAYGELTKLGDTVTRVAQTVLTKTGVIKGGVSDMGKGVEQSTSKMGTDVEKDVKDMGTKVEGSAADMATKTEASASAMATKTKASASDMATKTEASASTMATKTEASAAGMETKVAASASGMATKVEGDVAGMERKVEGEMAAGAGKAEGIAATESTAVKASFGAMAGAAALAGTGIFFAFKELTDNIQAKTNAAIANAQKTYNQQGGKLTPDQEKALAQQLANAAKSGGPFAAGTMSYPGGVGLVGEEGPELVNLPAGSQIFPAAQTRQMLSRAGGMRTLPGGAAGGGGTTVVQYVTIQVAGSVVGLDEFATRAAPAIRRKLVELVQVNGSSGLQL